MTEILQTLLIENCAMVACMDDERRELAGADIYMEGPAIKAVGHGLRAKLNLPPETPVIDGRGHLAVPGFVNTHHHFFQTLTRSIGRVQNAELFHWLVEQYHLFEAISPEMEETAATVALAELLLTGCTTSSDHHYLYPPTFPAEYIDVEIRVAKELGMRFHPTRATMSLGEDDGGLPPMTVIEKDEVFLADCERVIAQYHDTSPYSMCRIALAPCAPFNVTESLFRETVTIARKHGVKLHTHLAETSDEDVYCAKNFGKRPFDYVADMGWEGNDVWFAHCVKLNSEEITRFAKQGIAVAHCPSANSRLGSGVAPIPEMLRAGVAVGLGVDGSASNDSGDLLGEARLAFLIHRATWGVGSITPRDCLWMLTRGGAAVLGNDHIGRIEPGACADVVLWDMEQFAYAGGPSTDLVSALILCGTNHHASWSIINGKVVVERGKIAHLREKPVVQKANGFAAELLAHGQQKRGIDYRERTIW